MCCFIFFQHHFLHLYCTSCWTPNCFKEVAPSTAYSNRNEYDSSSLIWSSTGHNGDILIIIFLFVYIEKILKRFRSNSLNYKQDLHGKHSSHFSQFFTSKYLPPYCSGICSCLIFSLLSFCPPRLLSSSSSQTSLAILTSRPFPFLLYPFNLTGLSKFSIFFHMPTFPILPLLPTSALEAEEHFTIWSGQNPSHSFTNQPAVQTAELNPVARRIASDSEDLNKHYVLKQTLIYPHNSRQIRIW